MLDSEQSVLKCSPRLTDTDTNTDIESIYSHCQSKNQSVWTLSYKTINRCWSRSWCRSVYFVNTFPHVFVINDEWNLSVCLDHSGDGLRKRWWCVSLFEVTVVWVHFTERLKLFCRAKLLELNQPIPTAFIKPIYSLYTIYSGGPSLIPERSVSSNNAGSTTIIVVSTLNSSKQAMLEICDNVQ